MSSTPIEPGMLVECIDDKWDALTKRADPNPPHLHSRWAVIDVDDIASLPPSPVKFRYLCLRHKPAVITYIASKFRPVDGEFEKLKNSVAEQTDEVEFLLTKRKPVDA